MSSALVSTSEARPAVALMLTSAFELAYGRRTSHLAALCGTFCWALATVAVQVDSGPLGSVNSLRSIARSLPNVHTHHTYDWGGSAAKFRIENCAWCHHLVRLDKSNFLGGLVIFGTEKRRFFVCSHTPTHMTRMARRATRK